MARLNLRNRMSSSLTRVASIGATLALAATALAATPGVAGADKVTATVTLASSVPNNVQP